MEQHREHQRDPRRPGAAPRAADRIAAPARRRADDAAAHGTAAGAPKRRRSRLPQRRGCRRDSAPAPGARNTENYKTQPKAIKEPYSEQALRDVQRGARRGSVRGASRARRSSPRRADPKPAADRRPWSRASNPNPRRDPADGDEKVDWVWPAKGKVVTGFSEAASLKGIDIAGTSGQPVAASAGGKVVYAGTGLRGYGKLIIIKHNGTYLSAYAHNREILVKEGQQVTRGQKIAEMGNTDADQVKLHFEIRRQGQAGRSASLSPACMSPVAQGAPRATARGRASSTLPRIRASAERRRRAHALPDVAVATDEPRRPRPEPDRWTQELPLSEPAAGLGADIVNDVTQIYLNEIGQHLLLVGGGGALARARDGARRLRGAAAADRAQPAARRQHRQALHQPRARAPGPDRGRQPRAHPRAQQVRRRARLSLHDVRDVVDPPGGRARDHEPVAHGPAAGARRQGAERRAARAAAPRDARPAGGPRRRARRRRASARQVRRAGAQGAGLQRAHDLARRAARSRRRHLDRRQARRRGRAVAGARVAQHRDRGMGAACGSTS